MSSIEPGCAMAKRGRAPRHRLECGDEIEDRPLPGGDAGARRLLKRGDQTEPCLCCGDVGLRRLHLHSERLRLGACALRLSAGVLGGLQKGRGMRLGIGGGLLGGEQRDARIVEAGRLCGGGERGDCRGRQQDAAAAHHPSRW